MTKKCYPPPHLSSRLGIIYIRVGCEPRYWNCHGIFTRLQLVRTSAAAPFVSAGSYLECRDLWDQLLNLRPSERAKPRRGGTLIERPTRRYSTYSQQLKRISNPTKKKWFRRHYLPKNMFFFRIMFPELTNAPSDDP